MLLSSPPSLLRHLRHLQHNVTVQNQCPAPETPQLLVYRVVVIFHHHPTVWQITVFCLLPFLRHITTQQTGECFARLQIGSALKSSHAITRFANPLDLNAVRRKNATRETTAALKAWLYEHRKNPYPTKGEKIMLAIITKMTLTQVSTWFANARRRLKKENKMTWSPRNRSEDEDDSNLGGGGGNGAVVSSDDATDRPPMATSCPLDHSTPKKPKIWSIVEDTVKSSSSSSLDSCSQQRQLPNPAGTPTASAVASFMDGRSRYSMSPWHQLAVTANVAAGVYSRFPVFSAVPSFITTGGSFPSMAAAMPCFRPEFVCSSSLATSSASPDIYRCNAGIAAGGSAIMSSAGKCIIFVSYGFVLFFTSF
ncbi:unnamed protein product [Soboliphyme baturini]|uniref:Homeobox domain-containing protein n=1 Tax=Soboliphyme baturini TaxID=241478 RepID=A0A3P8ACU7_9BILA|nr:unnamed protein product [Soboliphyme baturini]